MLEQAKFERLLRIILSLTGGRTYSIAELAKRNEISERTVRRYLQTFEDSGFAVEKVNRRYRMATNSTPFKPISDLLYFTEEEAWILSQAIHSIDETNLLKQQLTEKLYAVYHFGKVAETIVNKAHSTTVHQLHLAIENQEQVILRSYRSSHGELVRDRLVEPFAFTSNFIALWAFDPESRQNKLFKTARIRSVSTTGAAAQFSDLHKASRMDVFRISSSQSIPVFLELSLRAYNLLIEEFPLAAKHIEQKDDNLWQFQTNVCGLEGVGRFVMGLPRDVKILEPLELKEYVRDEARVFCG